MTAALELYRSVKELLGEANCIIRLGDIALARSDHVAARMFFGEALAMYRRIPEPYSIGQTHLRLARIARNADERRVHLEAPAEAWRSLDRDDLVATLEAEK